MEVMVKKDDQSSEKKMKCWVIHESCQENHVVYPVLFQILVIKVDFRIKIKIYNIQGYF